MHPAATTRSAFVIALLAACLGHGSAQAQSSVMIWPLDPTIEEDQRAGAMWLENRGTQTVSMQVRVLGWTQPDHEDAYANQDAVVPSPPMAVIPAGQRQLIRLMSTRPAPDGKELAYRVLVDELPHSEGGDADAASRAGGSAMGIKLQIRYSVPLFVSGKGHWTKPRPDRRRDAASAAQPTLTWRTEREGALHFLVVRNVGEAHARLTAAQWVRGSEVAPINAGLLGYVLPGSEMRWRLDSPPPPDFVPQARINAGETPVRLTAQ